MIDVEDPEFTGGKRLGEKDYEALLKEGDPEFAWKWPEDEWQAISLNYTSGTTGDPKGVVYSHRGAYINGICNIVTWGMPHHAVYLWTLPMFHCNGWCFPWTMAANAGTNVCLRRVEAAKIFELIKAHKVTHYCGAPIVHSTLINAPEEMKKGISHKVSGMVAAAAPPAAMIEGMERLGFDITHVYGLTEVYGPGDRVREARGVGQGRHHGARETQWPPGRALPDGGGAHGDGPANDAARARRRRDHGRDHVPRQHHDEGIPEESEVHAGRLRGRVVP